MKRFTTLLSLLGLVLVAMFAFVGSASARETAQTEPNIVELALEINAQTGEFDTLIAAVVCTNLAKPLSVKQGVTVFAPTDAAFDALGLNADNICELIPRKDLSYILLYHLAQGTLDSGTVVSLDQIRMANGLYTDITVNDQGAFINEAQIIGLDNFASNGVIHVIDGVLLP